MKRIKVECLAACEKSKDTKLHYWQYTIYDADNPPKRMLSSKGTKDANMTRDTAAYEAVLQALEAATIAGLPGTPILLSINNRLVVKQLQGRWAIKGGVLLELNRKAIALLSKFQDYQIECSLKEKQDK